MKLTQDEIRRIARREARSAARSGGGAYAGGVSEAWIADNFISKDFFNRLFRAHGKDGSTATDIDPNDTETAVTDIEAKAGLWTQQSVSSLGKGEGGGGGGGSSTLEGLNDVQLTSPQINDMLVYNGTKWVNQVQPNLSSYATRAYVDQQDNAVKNWAGNTFVTPSALATYIAQNQGTWRVAYAADAGRASALDSSYNCTAWGQAFFSNGVPQNVSGNMTDVGSISANGTIETINTDGADIIVGTYAGGYSLHMTYDKADNRGLYDIKEEDWLIGTTGVNTFINVGNVGIGTSSPAYKLDVKGTIHASNIVYADSNVTTLSDIRKKRILGDAAPKIEQVATARAVEFEWREHPERGRKVGSIAQDWQQILPQAVVEREDGILTLDYSVTALLSAISAAREIVKLKQRIEQLENIIKEKNHG